MNQFRVVEFLVRSGWTRKKAVNYVNVLVGLFWGQLKTAY